MPSLLKLCSGDTGCFALFFCVPQDVGCFVVLALDIVVPSFIVIPFTLPWGVVLIPKTLCLSIFANIVKKLRIT